jgi:hypothetical protein
MDRAPGLTQLTLISSVALLITPPAAALIVTDVSAIGLTVLIVNAPDVSPAGIAIDTDKLVMPLCEVESLTIIPPVGAGPLSVTVPIEELPPTTELGDTTSVFTEVILIPSVALFVTPLRLAEITALTLLVTGEVFTVNVAAVEPSGIETEGATVAAGLLLDKAISTPAGGAGALSVTVAVELDPPARLVGFRTRILRSGIILIVVEAVELVAEAVMVALLAAVTGYAVTVKVALVLPALTTTLLGTPAIDGSEDESETIIPPLGAGRSIVTFPRAV